MKYLLLIILFFSCLAAHTLSLKKISNETTVQISTGSSIGSGFFIAPKLLVTNHHVIDNAEDSTIYFRTLNGRESQGTVIVIDKKYDLAIIQTLTRSDSYLKLANSDKVKLADFVSVIGSPQRSIGTLSQGIISAIRKEGNQLQFTAPTSPGSSGSPILSKNNKVIGVVTNGSQTGNLSLGTSSNRLRHLIKSNLPKLKKSNKMSGKSNYTEQLTAFESKKNKTVDDFNQLAYSHYLQKNYKKAFHYYKQAAKQKNATGQLYLGAIYYTGYGTSQNYKKAFYYFKKSAKQKNAEAQYSLSVMYYRGLGVSQSNMHAYAWANIAAINGNTRAMSNRDKFSNRMTPEEISKAKKFSEFLSKRLK